MLRVLYTSFFLSACVAAGFSGYIAVVSVTNFALTTEHGALMVFIASVSAATAVLLRLGLPKEEQRKPNHCCKEHPNIRSWCPGGDGPAHYIRDDA